MKMRKQLEIEIDDNMHVRDKSREIILKIDVEVHNLNMKIDMIHDDKEKVKKKFFIYSNKVIIEREFIILHRKSYSNINS